VAVAAVTRKRVVIVAFVGFIIIIIYFFQNTLRSLITRHARIDHREGVPYHVGNNFYGAIAVPFKG